MAQYREADLFRLGMADIIIAEDGKGNTAVVYGRSLLGTMLAPGAPLVFTTEVRVANDPDEIEHLLGVIQAMKRPGPFSFGEEKI